MMQQLGNRGANTGRRSSCAQPKAPLISLPMVSNPRHVQQQSNLPPVCKASMDSSMDGSMSQIVSGPIVVNPMIVPASDPVTAASQSTKPVDRSKGLWTRCDKCGVILYVKHLKEHHHICFSCNYHLKMTSEERVNHLLDPGTWRSLDDTLSPVDPLEFTDIKLYTERIKDAQNKTGLQDAVRTGTGLLHGIPIALGVMDFGYMGGSMGSVVGEKLTRLIEYATTEGLVLMIVCTSGGARMQEGILSLMQMAKISGALHIYQNQANLLYISILTSPTTGGVTASFGMLGDIIIAEPQAIIGFAGRRVIEQTLAEQLPDDFQTAEYLLEHGLLDLVIPRSFLKGALYETMQFYKDAPYKRQGAVPFGVQHGMYLTTEEKVRRKWRDFAANKASETAHSSALSTTADSESPLSVTDLSYKELVGSFSALLGPGAGSASLAAADVKEAVSDERLLAEALALARDGRVEWLDQAQPLRTSEERKFIFRLATESST